MIPKKLFTPKCLHPDRDIVFRDDLLKFYYTIINKIEITKENEIEKIENFTYPNYKTFYKKMRISMFHFSKTKEENSKEYYEVLFGEIQLFLFNKTDYKFFNKLFSIYTLYSIYFTQISNEFYEINTIPEYLNELNILIKELYNNKKLINLAYDLYNIVNQLYTKNAFSIGVLLGLKSIILNKYGLPVEPKNNVYKDYYDIFNYKFLNNQTKNLNEDEDFNKVFNEYSQVKREIINDIKKDLVNKEEYVNYINDTLLNDYNNINNNMDNFPNVLIENLDNDEQKIKLEDLEDDNNVNNFDCLFNKVI